MVLSIGSGGRVGRVRTTLIKRVSKVLLERFPDRFSGDFSSNKAVVAQLTDLESKKLIDQVAGLITHTKKLNEKR